MLNEVLQNIVQQQRQLGAPDFVIKNYIKEYLQYPVLSYIYNDPQYSNMIFMGGSCLRVCFNLPRLSEDLDFDLIPSEYKKFNIDMLASDLEDYFQKVLLINIVVKIQGVKRIYLKFPILRELGIAGDSDSDLLYVKVEPEESAFTSPTIDVQPISSLGFNFVVRRYDLSFLMSGKINAIFLRQWFSGENNAVDIKGRDFYDLFWYLERGVVPNFKNLQKSIGISDFPMLKRKLLERIDSDVTSQKLNYDLKNFFSDQNFVNDFCKNYKKIITNLLK